MKCSVLCYRSPQALCCAIGVPRCEVLMAGKFVSSEEITCVTPNFEGIGAGQVDVKAVRVRVMLGLGLGLRLRLY